MKRSQLEGLDENRHVLAAYIENRVMQAYLNQTRAGSPYIIKSCESPNTPPLNFDSEFLIIDGG